MLHENKKHNKSSLLNFVCIGMIFMSDNLLAHISTETKPVHGHEIEINGIPIVSGEGVVGGKITLESFPIASDEDGDEFDYWKYYWRIDNASYDDEAEGVYIRYIDGDDKPFLQVDRSHLGHNLSFCLRAKAKSGYPVTTTTSDRVCSNVIRINNSIPLATNLTLSGPEKLGGEIIASYSFHDVDGDEENQSIYKWYRYSSPNDETSKILIDGEFGLSYRIKSIDRNKYIQFEVTPKSNSSESSIGYPVRVISNKISDQLGMIGNFSVPSTEELNFDDALSYCSELNQDGYNGWSLPTKNQLLSLYAEWPNNEISTVHGWRTTESYWSRTMYSDSAHYSVSLKDGSVLDNDDEHTRLVTCVHD